MLGRRALLTGLLASLGAGSALAQNAAPTVTRPNAPRPAASPVPPRNPELRRQRRQAEKIVTAPEPPGKPAPVPNRDIEAPRGLNEPPRASQKVLIPSRKKGPNLSTSPRTIYLLYVIHTMFFPGSYVIPSRKKNSESSRLSCVHTIIYDIFLCITTCTHGQKVKKDVCLNRLSVHKHH